LTQQEEEILFYTNIYFELYILILLGLGIISHIISQESGKKETFGSLGIIYEILAIGLLRFIVW